MPKISAKADIEVTITLQLDPANFWTMYRLVFEGSERVERATSRALSDEFERIKAGLEHFGYDEDWYQARKWL